MKEVSVVEIVDDIIQVQLNGVPKNSYFVADIFDVLGKHSVNIDMISQILLEDETRIGFTCKVDDQHRLNDAVAILESKYSQISVIQNRMVAQINVEGEGMKEAVGVAAKIYKVFGEYNVPIHQVATSLTTISYIVDKNDAVKVQSQIKEMYDL